MIGLARHVWPSIIGSKDRSVSELCRMKRRCNEMSYMHAGQN